MPYTSPLSENQLDMGYIRLAYRPELKVITLNTCNKPTWSRFVFALYLYGEPSTGNCFALSVGVDGQFQIIAGPIAWGFVLSGTSEFVEGTPELQIATDYVIGLAQMYWDSQSYGCTGVYCKHYSSTASRLSAYSLNIAQVPFADIAKEVTAFRLLTTKGILSC